MMSLLTSMKENKAEIRISTDSGIMKICNFKLFEWSLKVDGSPTYFHLPSLVTLTGTFGGDITLQSVEDREYEGIVELLKEYDWIDTRKALFFERYVASNPSSEQALIVYIEWLRDSGLVGKRLFQLEEELKIVRERGESGLSGMQESEAPSLSLLPTP